MSDFTNGFIVGACGALFSFILGVIFGIKWWEWKAIKAIHEIECAQNPPDSDH